MADYKDEMSFTGHLESLHGYAERDYSYRDAQRSFERDDEGALKSKKLQIIRARTTESPRRLPSERGLSKGQRKALFAELSARWKRETMAMSSPYEQILNYSYQRIIGLGWEALPFILNDLRETQDSWFWALWVITGEEVVTPDISGDVEAMTQRWLDWGRAKGII